MGAINGLKTAIDDIKTNNELSKLSVIFNGGYELSDIRQVVVRPTGFIFVHGWQMGPRLDVVETFVYYDAIDGIRYTGTRTLAYDTVAADPASPNRITAGKALLQTAKTILDGAVPSDPEHPDIDRKLKSDDRRNKDIYLYVGGKWISSFLDLDLTDAEVAKIKNVFLDFVPVEANWLLKYARIDAIVIPYNGTGVL